MIQWETIGKRPCIIQKAPKELKFCRGCLWLGLEARQVSEKLCQNVLQGEENGEEEHFIWGERNPFPYIAKDFL